MSGARAEDPREELPFLADGAAYPGGRPPPLLWPELRPGSEVPGLELAGDGTEKPLAALPSRVPAFPDVERLLAPFTGLDHTSSGSVGVPADHPDRDAVLRLLDAVRAGYARDLHVEIALVRPRERAHEIPDAELPDAAAILAGSAELRVDVLTRAGALGLDDARREATYPARAEVMAVLATPDSVVFRVGPRVAFTVTPLPGGVHVLDLDLTVSRAFGPERFDDPVVRRFAPVVDFLAVRAAIPLTDGEATLVEVCGARLAVRVTAEGGAAPDGTRVLPLPAYGRALPAAARPSLDELDPYNGDTSTWDTADERLRAVPDAWDAAARRAGVRLSFVPPAIAIAQGDADALGALDDALRPLLALEARLVDAHGVRLPVVAGTPFTCASGRLVPTRTTSAPEVVQSRATNVGIVTYPARGTFVHGAPDGDRMRVVVDRAESAGPSTSRELPLVSRHGGGGPETLVLDQAPVRRERHEATVAPGEPAADGIAVERIEVGR